MEGMQQDAAMQVLEEIKALLDSRLTDKLKPQVAEVTKVEIEPKEGEAPEMGMQEEDDKDLEAMYSKLMG